MRNWMLMTIFRKAILKKMKDSVEMRKSGETVRFVYDASMPLDLLEYLMEALNLKTWAEYYPRRDIS